MFLNVSKHEILQKKKSEKRKHASFHFDIGKVYATTSNEQKRALDFHSAKPSAKLVNYAKVTKNFNAITMPEFQRLRRCESILQL